MLHVGTRLPHFARNKRYNFITITTTTTTTTTFIQVFTITHVKQTMFIGYIVLKLFCSHNLWHMYCYFQCWVFHAFTAALSKVCVHCQIWLSAVVPWCLLILLLLLLLLSQSTFQVHTMHTKQIVTYKCLTKVKPLLCDVMLWEICLSYLQVTMSRWRW